MKKHVLNLALLLVLVSAWYSLARGHDFAQPGDSRNAVTPANMDLDPSDKFQTATFALG